MVEFWLEGEAKDRFLTIKKAKGLKSNDEVLRLIITEYYEKKFGAYASN